MIIKKWFLDFFYIIWKSVQQLFYFEKVEEENLDNQWSSWDIFQNFSINQQKV